ncbi:Protein kinase domain [Dillenia turbinata]|uniref:non-specific serine/threonine protein kinase n=1 Tax=Dillenia turbinata TaxID=194707 RepID=A0AAN8Z0H0_9MAGN
MGVLTEDSLNFNYTSFSSTPENLNITGDAFASDSSIQLTSNQNDKEMNQSVGHVIYTEPLPLWDKASGKSADFTTQFNFAINSLNNTNYGDGMAFFLASEDHNFTNTSRGGSLGLNGSTASFVAVEFDTYKNYFDPPAPHVGIDINSTNSSYYTAWSSRSSIPKGRSYNASVSYNSTLQNLTVVFTSYSNYLTEMSQNLSYQINLSNYLTEKVYIGFAAATGDSFEIHCLNSWSLIWSNLQVEPLPKAENRIGLVIGIVVGSCALIGVLCLTWLVKQRRRIRRTREERTMVGISLDDELGKSTGPKYFLYADLVRATQNFAEEEKLGEGGFGGVYRGFLKESNSCVAVKRISRGSKQGKKEYVSEVKIISQLRHRNLVQLIGWCHENGDLLLVYEYMPNGSLDSHLFPEASLLAWTLRYKIALGLASALQYLHEEWERCVLHRDIKSSNVMLDSSFNAKLGDFGLAKLVDHGKASETTLVGGTIGYMAFEYMVSGRASKESDVYSFGIVALEIACGRRAIICLDGETHVRLVDWVWKFYASGKLLEAADPKLGGDFVEKEMECLITVGLWCAHPHPHSRPSIGQALRALNSEAQIPILPQNMPAPPYFSPSIEMTSLPSLSIKDGTESSGYDYYDGSLMFSSSSASISTASLLNTS